MKYYFLVFLFIISASGLLSQERWSESRKPVIGTYSKLPSETNSWQNTNTKVSVYQDGDYVVTVGPNIRVLPSPNAQQDEIVLVRHP